MKKVKLTDESIDRYSKLIKENDFISVKDYEHYDIKKGLRDKSGKGVLAGVTNISMVNGSREENGERVPIEGELYYRGYNINDLVKGAVKRFKEDGRVNIFEEAAFLLLFGQLPTMEQLVSFKKELATFRTLPSNFTRDVIMKAPSHDLMNSLTRSVLTLQSYDSMIDDPRLSVQLLQCIKLIAEFPMLAVYAYHAYNYSVNKGNMYICRPNPEYSTGENILLMLRQDGRFTPLEAQVLDVALMLHMEHGGGNNSTFTTRVITSAGSDTYAVMAAALSSLKGPKHGGANIKVMQMMDDIRANVTDLKDKDEVKAYIEKIVAGQAFDRKRLVYGMGHAIYSLSDPRAEVFKGFVEKLAKEKKKDDDYDFYRLVEECALEVIPSKRKIYKGVCCNVDFYSGFVYSMLGIPQELYTPLFAIARIVGWSAHRMEELVNCDKIIRPAYQSVMKMKDYKGIEDR